VVFFNTPIKPKKKPAVKDPYAPKKKRPRPLDFTRMYGWMK
jgi:hypothetical protein